MSKNKWEFDPDNWPDQRNNWRKLNKSQKSYTVIQYNKARFNRNLPPIPNPFSSDPNAVYYRIPPNSPLAKKFPNYVDTELITRPSVNKPNITPIPARGPLIDAFAKQEPPPPVVESYNPEDFDDSELLHLFKSNKFTTILNDVTSTSPSPIAGPSNSHTSTTQTTEATKSTPSPKRQRTGESPLETTSTASTTTPSSVTTNNPIETSMVLPGSGRDDDMQVDGHTTAGGSPQGYSGGLATEKGTIIPAVPRPYNFRMMDGFGHIKNVFSCLSYGFATRILPHPGNITPATATSAFIVCATTPLLEIPWDRVNMYINQGVYDSLPIGSYVKSVHCKVIQRNVRVAFETAASTTSLATLNQNKFALMAVGLNTKNDIRVTNMRYSVADNATSMVPITLSDPVYSDIDECLWGYNQSSNSFNGTNATATNSIAVPMINFSFNTTIHPRNYLTAWNTGYKATNSSNVNNVGWYNLSQHISKVPTTKVIDDVIINQSYYPTYAPLKGQLGFCEYLRDTLNVTPPTGTAAVAVNFNTLSFNDHDNRKEFEKIVISNLSAANDSNPSETSTTVNTTRNNFTLQVSRNALIEKGQFYKQIDSSHHGKYIQPSIHVGIAAVPKLTTAIDQLYADEFTDVQSYYDVELDMVIGFNYQHNNTFQDTFNVNANEIRMASATNTVGNRPTSYIPNRFGHQATY